MRKKIDLVCNKSKERSLTRSNSKRKLSIVSQASVKKLTQQFNQKSNIKKFIEC